MLGTPTIILGAPNNTLYYFCTQPKEARWVSMIHWVKRPLFRPFTTSYKSLRPTFSRLQLSRFLWRTITMIRMGNSYFPFIGRSAKMVWQVPESLMTRKERKDCSSKHSPQLAVKRLVALFKSSNPIVNILEVLYFFTKY